MNDILVTLLFLVFASAWLAWRLNDSAAKSHGVLTGLAGCAVVFCLGLVTLLWVGIFSETWIIGVLSLAGSLVFVGDMIPWDRIFHVRMPGFLLHRINRCGTESNSAVCCRLAKTMYFAFIGAVFLMAFLVEGERPFLIDVFSNLGRVDDFRMAQEIAMEKYAERFGRHSLADRPFTVRQSRNVFRITFRHPCHTRQPVFEEESNVVVVVDRRTGEARIVDCEGRDLK